MRKVVFWSVVLLLGLGSFASLWILPRTFAKTVLNREVIRIPSESMRPALNVNDIYQVDLGAYHSVPPAVGDIIVFVPPEDAVLSHQKGLDIKFIKRCVGVAGDLIEIKDKKLYRNGKLVLEPYAARGSGDFDFKLVKFKGKIFPVLSFAGRVNQFSSEPYRVEDQADQDALLDAPAVPIPEGYLLALGDNRPDSRDGRFWGPLPVTNVKGKLLVGTKLSP